MKLRLLLPLAIALFTLGLTPVVASAKNVALFTDPRFIDLAETDAGAEGLNMLFTLNGLSHGVTEFEDTTFGAWRSAINGRHAAVLPKNEGDPFTVTSIDANTAAGLRAYVVSGGTLIVTSTNELEFLNGLFGYSLTDQGVVNPIGLVTGNAVGTRFVGAPSFISNNNATHSVDIDSVPGNGRVIYADAGGGAPVVLISHGAGAIVFLGWDWYGADGVPNCVFAESGCQDGGWFDVLDAAIGDTTGTFPAPPTVVPPDDVAPVLSKLTPSKKSLKVTLTEAATVTVKISKQVTKTKKGRKRKVYVLKKTVVKSLPAGPSTIKLAELRKGTYRFVASAKDATGNESKVVRKTKRIK